MARFPIRPAAAAPSFSFLKKCLLRGLLAMRLVLPASDHPAASQSTPFNLNRFCLLTIYLFYVAISSCIYLGWGPLSAMLFRQQLFVWECSPEEEELVAAAAAAAAGSAVAAVDHSLCRAQAIAVQTLFTSAFAAHFCVSAIAGVLTDTAGPKVTAVLGQALNICGWFILGGSSITFRAAFPAFILIGAASGMSYLPMLCIVHLFPGSTGFGLTVMGAAGSLGLGVPLLMNKLNLLGLSFKVVLWLYTLFGPVVCLVIVCLFVPLNGFIEVDRFVLVKQDTDNAAAAAAAADANADEASVAVLPSDPSAPAGAPPGAPRGPLSLFESEGDALSSVTDETFFKPFKTEACTFLYIGLCVYFAISSVVMNYYQQSANLFLSDKAYEALHTALPLSIIPCVILGRLADFVSVIHIMVFLNVAGLLSVLLAIVRADELGVESVAFFSIYMSLFSSQVYVFVAHLFSSVHFGKLVGVVNLLGGLFSLSSNYLYDKLTMQRHGADPEPVMWGLLGCLCLSLFLILPMAVVGHRKIRRLKAMQTIAEENSDNRNVDREASAPPEFHSEEFESSDSKSESEPNAQHTPRGLLLQRKSLDDVSKEEG